MNAFLIKKRPYQYSTVSLNGNVIGTIDLKLGDENPQSISFNLPSELVKTNEINTITFKIDRPVSPASVEYNSDNRPLGLKLRSLVLR